MTIRTNSRCRWTPLAASFAALFATAGPASAQAGVPPTAPETTPAATDMTPPTDAQELYLEVSINQSATGQIVRVLLDHGRLHADADALRGLDLRWPGSDTAGGLVALDTIPGLQAHYDAARQHLELTAPLETMSGERERFGAATVPMPRVDPATQAPGLLINYDAYAQDDGDYRSASLFADLRLFGVGPGIWNNSLVSRATRSPIGDDVHDTLRLDSWWQLDLQERMLTVVAGDTYTAALPWTRSTRIGGLQFSTNFGLQPYRVTTPLASFAGDAVLPSTVDLFIDGVRQSSQQVQPGQFQIDTVPNINGVGNAQMLITDINGQARVVNFAMYNTTRLLQDGLTDWSLEAGTVRRNYGERSWDYAPDPMASATVRHGLSNRTTLSAHAEGTADLQMAGVGGSWLLGDRGGVFDLSVAGSRHQGRDGHQYGAAYQWNSRVFNVNLATLRGSDAFADVASLEDAVLPLRTDRVFLGVTMGRSQLGTSYVRQDYPVQPRTRFANLSWSLQLPRSAYLSLNLSRDLDRPDSDSAFLYWSMPLDPRTSVSATARHTTPADSVGVEINRSVDGDLGGWGWRAQATGGDERSGQLQVSQLGRFGAWDAGVFHRRGQGGADDSTSVYAGADGGLLLMAGHAFAMRRVDDAFALVSTDGIADVPILLENREIGRTDGDGLLLVNRLNAWQNNRLSIDPLAVPVDVQLDRTEMWAVPESRSGMLARFPMRAVRSAQLTVTDAAGAPLPAGSPVWFTVADPATDPPATVVGYDGQVYLPDLPSQAGLRIRHNGRTCEAELPEPAAASFAELDKVVCR